MAASIITALRMCDALPDIWGREQTFYVHSVFKHACNIKTMQGTLWALQTRDAPLAPLGITLACDDLRYDFRSGMTLVHRGDAFAFSGGQIFLRTAVPCSTLLHPQGKRFQLQVFHRNITAYLMRQSPKGIALALQNDAAMIAACDEFACWLRNGDGDIEAIARRLIGWGEGLTPSGDDFILGVLLVLSNWRCSPYIELLQTLSKLLHLTTDISRAMLQQAMDGRYSAFLLQLMAQESAWTPEFFARVANYGHSSGLDMLSGMAMASGVSYQWGEKLLLD